MIKKVLSITGTILCLTTITQAMIIHNYACDKGERNTTESGVFSDDYLFMGHDLNFSGKAEDLIFIGKDLKVNGKTELGIISLCKELTFEGDCGNGIIAVGKNININGSVASNSFIVGKSIVLRDKSDISGSIFAGGAELKVNGKLNGNLYAAAGKIIINNEIKGDVHIYTGRIEFGDRGKIDGNFYYSAKEKLSEYESKKISGEIKFTKINENRSKDKWNSRVRLIFGAILFISFLITGCVLLFVPVFRNLNKAVAERKLLLNTLWGFLTLVIYPVVTLISILLVVTLPLGFTLLLGFIPVHLIATIIGITFAGKYIITKSKINATNRHYQFLIGVIALGILLLLPVVNCLCMLIISSIGWGYLVTSIFKRN